LLKTIIIIVLIAGAALAGIAICAYVLKIPFAQNTMNTITEPFANLTSGGNLNLQTIASGASIAAATTTAVGWIKSNKDKAVALKNSAETEIKNSGLLENVNSLKETKTELEAQITEINKVKEDAIAEAEAVKNQFNQQSEELQKAKTTIDTLHETLRRNKLSENEAIIKKVIL